MLFNTPAPPRSRLPELREFCSRFPGRDTKRLEALLTLMPTIKRIARKD
jgi:hypothetical protein